MCYSAQIKAEYKKFVRMFGALMSLKDFAKLYAERELDARIKIPKSMDALFMAPQSDLEAEIKGRIEAFNATQATQFVQVIQERQGLKIACPEEVAYFQGRIDHDKLGESVAKYAKTPYGEYLASLL